MNIFQVSKPRSLADLPAAWLEVIGGRHVSSVIFCDFGLGEKCIALMHFEDGSYEVGEGEALRPYTQHYQGDDAETASSEWLDAINSYRGD